jgi:hypothetical protein
MRTSLLPVLAVGLVQAGCAVTQSTSHEGAPGANASSAAVVPDEYEVPEGFFGYAWGTRLPEIPDLRLLADGAAMVAGFQGKVMDVRIQNCIPGAEEAGPCAIHQRVEGAGSYVMASYFRDFEPYNPYPAADLAAAIYYFCARTNGDYVSRHVGKQLQLCGGDMVFQSDAPEISHAGEPETNYDRMVRALTRRHGRPDDFEYSGYAIVEDEHGKHSLPRPQSYRPLYWCKITQRALDPSCEATISLEFDVDTGTGRVLFATDAVYRFAEAMHETSEEKIPLYERLHGFDPDRFKSKRRVCTGTRLCGGGGRRLTPEELGFLQPDPGD